jgi:hypothetical protein
MSFVITWGSAAVVAWAIARSAWFDRLTGGDK